MKTTVDITKAVNILHTGGLVAFPTETVYGLGANAADESAVLKIFSAKERPYNNPLIVHIATIDQLKDWAMDISPDTLKLAQAFCPGPLTFILQKKPHVLDVLTGGQETIALRIPNHPVAQALLQAFKGGIAAPSANKFTRISPTSASAVQEELSTSVDCILDGGDCELGLESTILDMRGTVPVILRPGMITAKEIEAVLGTEVRVRSSESSPRAPGMHDIHYAPLTKTVLITTDEVSHAIKKLSQEDMPAALVYHSAQSKQIQLSMTKPLHWVEMPPTASAYAHQLYRTLRSLDSQHLKLIMIEAVPSGAEWEAITDRLTRAAASRLSGWHTK